LHRVAGGVEEAGGDEVVLQKAAEQVLHRQVVDRLRPDLVVGAASEDLAVDHRLANRLLEGGQMVGCACVAQLEPAGVAQVMKETIAKLVRGRLFEIDGRQHLTPRCAELHWRVAEKVSTGS